MPKSLREQVLKLHAEMREQIIASGIQEAEADAPIKAPDDLEGLKLWLDELKSGAYARVMATYSLREPQYWVNLVTLFGQHNTREQKDLRRARHLLRKAWRKRYGKQSEATVDDINQEGAQ